MKTLGIIGGLGPATTAEFYLKVSYGCQQRNNIQRPPVIIASVPAPYEVERGMILHNINNYTPLLLVEAKRLEKAGADFLVMPCNTLHCDIEQIRSVVTIPVMSIVDATITYIKANKHKKIGLIATAATVEREVYSSIFKRNNIDFITPEEARQVGLNELIANLVAGKFLKSDKEFIHAVVDDLKEKGADCIALACTDLQLLNPEADRDDIPIFDTMAILAEAAIEEIICNQ